MSVPTPDTPATTTRTLHHSHHHYHHGHHQHLQHHQNHPHQEDLHQDLQEDPPLDDLHQEAVSRRAGGSLCSSAGLCCPHRSSKAGDTRASEQNQGLKGLKLGLKWIKRLKWLEKSRFSLLTKIVTCMVVLPWPPYPPCSAWCSPSTRSPATATRAAHTSETAAETI